jgi:arylsulfatase A-like enzyme/Tfp pilus assembly protein PilF
MGKKKGKPTSPRNEEPKSTLKAAQSPAGKISGGAPAGKSRKRRLLLRILLPAMGLLLIAFFQFGLAVPRFDFKGTNLVVITLDTTRADHLGAYGYDKIKTPNLDDLASRGTLFRRAISQVPLTLPSHTSLFTGTFPVHHGVRDNGGYFVPPAAVTLAEVLKQNGYRTAAFVSAFVLDSKWGLDQGFETYFDDFDITKADETGMGEVQRPGGQTNEAALRWMQRTDAKAPFFVWIHYYDPHDPYEPPEPFRTEYSGRLYDGEIAYTDTLVGQVIDALKARGLLKKTIIIVAGDHGEGLGQHHEENHGVFLYGEALHVPLIITLPARAAGKVDQTVELVDVMPTVLDLLQIARPKPVQGRSLVPLMRRGKLPESPALSESLYAEKHYGWSPLYSLMTDSFHFIESPKPELFDVRSDPGENKNLYSPSDPMSKTMRERVQELLQQYAAGGQQQASAEMDLESQEILKSLGYIGSGPSEKMKESGRNIDPKDKIELVESVHAAFGDMHHNRYDEAKIRIEKIIAADPEMVDAHFLQGMIASKQERYQDAVSAFQDTLKLRPDHLFAVFNLALVFRKTGDSGKAMEGFKEVLRQDPHYVYAMVNLAELYAERKDPEKASEYYHRAIRRYEEMLQSSTTVDAIASIHDTMSGVYFSEGKLDDAQREIEALVRLQPGRPDAHYNLAQIYETRGEAQKAEEEYRNEIRYNPTNMKAYNDLAVLLWESKQFDRAVPALQDLLKLQPDSFAGCYMLADSMLQTGGDLQQARSLAERAVQINPQFRRAAELLAEIKRRLQ